MKKRILLCLLPVLFLTGCASKLMSPVTDNENIIPEDKAVITFFRTSKFGGAVQAPIAHETGDGEIEFVGVSSTKTKIRHVVEPGEHVYVVSGESADILKAKVEANKAYYVRIEPKMGWWKARFANKVMRKKHAESPKIKAAVSKSRLVTINERGKQWFEEKKKDMYLKMLKGKYIYEGASEKYQKSRTMNPEDGIDTLY